tara:strand:+ start:20 stop:685 length:666 start_codon:yes stop_codon:yes gene_type:complete
MEQIMYNVIIADDHFLIREGIKKIFENSRNFKIIAEASNGDSALCLIDQYNCDLLISDISMPDGIDGLDLVKELKNKYPESKAILITMFTDETYIYGALISEADGMISKDSLHKDLLGRINSIMNGEKYFLGKSEKELKQIFEENKKFSKKVVTDLNELSLREIDVIKLIADGMTSTEIAAKLNINKRTVDTHRQHIMSKLQIKSTPELILRAAKIKEMMR